MCSYSVFDTTIYMHETQYPACTQRWNNVDSTSTTSRPWINIRITHGFSCINLCRLARKLFEHEAARQSVQISSEGPSKCYCSEITMNYRCSCITFDSNGKLWRKRPKAPYKLFKCDGKPTWRPVQNVVYNDATCEVNHSRHHKILKCYVQGDNVTSQSSVNKARPILWYQKFKIHVQTAREFHDLNIGFVVWTRLLIHSTIASKAMFKGFYAITLNRRCSNAVCPLGKVQMSSSLIISIGGWITQVL